MYTDVVPTSDVFRPLVLRALADGSEYKFNKICQLVADLAQLSPDARTQILASGQARHVNRIGWACSALSLAGLLERTKRGVYRITPDGKEVHQRNLTHYTEKDLLEWPKWRSYQKELKTQKSKNSAPANIPVLATEHPDIDPVEEASNIVDEYNSMTEVDLRSRLQASSPEFFEKAVIELLWAMGYGGSHGQKRHTGRSGDGGIDGVIQQDALGLQNVYIQAKRYSDSNTVQRPEIQQFYGAFDGLSAERGVFITTSQFSDGARAQADRYGGRVILIDGARLASLMLDYRVAVQNAASLTMLKVDEDFFEQDF